MFRFCACANINVSASLWTKAGAIQISCVLQEGKLFFSSDVAYENTAEEKLEYKIS